MANDQLLDEQIAYYRSIAGEYEDHAIDVAGGAELRAAFEAFDISGDVLELACGRGVWTQKIVKTAASVTAVDASPEMIARARALVGDSPVEFVEADLFSWRPSRHYDSLFFGFWLSHVPDEHFESFWSMVADALTTDGQVFFVDDSYRTDAELIEGPASSVVERRLNDGTAFRAVKVPHEPAELESRLRVLGWDITVAGEGPFYWGSGTRMTKPT